MKQWRVPEIFLGVFLTVAVFAIGYGSSWLPTHQPSNESASAEQPQQDPLSAFWHWTTHDPAAFYTAVLTLFTGGLWFSTFYLWRETRDARKLAREEFIATHRPRVIVRFVQGPWSEANMHPVRAIEGFPRALAQITVQNVGETRATIFEFGGAIGYHHAGKWQPPGIQASAQPIAERVLNSGERTTFEVRSPPEIPFMVVENRAPGGGNQGETFLLGIVRYRDEGGVARETAFHRGFDPSRSNSFERVPGTEEEYAD